MMIKIISQGKKIRKNKIKHKKEEEEEKKEKKKKDEEENLKKKDSKKKGMGERWSVGGLSRKGEMNSWYGILEMNIYMTLSLLLTTLYGNFLRGGNSTSRRFGASIDLGNWAGLSPNSL